MPRRFDAFLRQYQLPFEGEQELRSIIQECIQESLRLGRSTMEETLGGLPSESVIPQSNQVVSQTNQLPNQVRTIDPGKRYEDLGCLGYGSMGEVRRVKDKHLKRVVAMKVLRPDLVDDYSLLARFIEEAQATAQLQHPGIIPLHDLGQFEDGRYYFTMKEVKGATLSHIVEELHQQSRYHGRWSKTSNNWTFRRILSAFRDACKAVGYAHSRGVLHRDIKPDNIMLGAHGEVLILDWGLVKVKARFTGDTNSFSEDFVVTDRAKQQTYATKIGEVTGTPMYMSPEQARGEELDLQSDVYALGAVLYEILSGRPPYIADTLVEVMEQVLEGPPAPLAHTPEELQQIWAMNPYFRAPLPVPKELVSTCVQAMARHPQERHPNAEELAEAIDQWLEGDLKREQAQKLLSEAYTQGNSISQLLQQATVKSNQASELAKQINIWEPGEQKLALWQLQDQASELRLQAKRKSQDFELLLEEALIYDPLLHEARLSLSENYKEQHIKAEQKGLDEQRIRIEQKLQNQIRALSPSQEERASLTAYLKGDGTLSLQTDPPGASVEIYEFEEQNRRLVAMGGQSLGRTPLVNCPLPMGQYMLLIQLQGYEELRMPIHILRQEQWKLLPPGQNEPLAVPLIPQGILDGDERYIAPGWFVSGGDIHAMNHLPTRRLWLDGFVIQRFPVTLRMYISFLNHLWREGRGDEATYYVPRHTGEGDPLDSMLFLSFTAQDGFTLDDHALSEAHLDCPVTQINWSSAQEFARWYSQLRGATYTLPDEFVWEKAARGVDGRLFPWGSFFDPSWCNMADSHSDAPTLDTVNNWGIDKSPYGIRGTAGNTRDWCSHSYQIDGPHPRETAARVDKESQPFLERGHSSHSTDETSVHTVRGGAWNENATHTRTSSRNGVLALGHYDNVGFRLVRWL